MKEFINHELKLVNAPHLRPHASLVLPDGTSQPSARTKGRKAFRAQEHFQQQAKKAAKAREHERAMTFEPHVPAS